MKKCKKPNHASQLFPHKYKFSFRKLLKSFLRIFLSRNMQIYNYEFLYFFAKFLTTFQKFLNDINLPEMNP